MEPNMGRISYDIVQFDKDKVIELIASWYLSEWKIPVETTIEKLSQLPAEGVPFQVVMKLNDLPIATGGMYNHVGLLDREPRFKIYKPWLALVYTIPEYRNKGYGALLCGKIQDRTKDLGFKKIFLFTHTAESLYKRLDWDVLERTKLGGKRVAVMGRGL
jgi:GNAT superfamily N-acetyltransferase